MALKLTSLLMFLITAFETGFIDAIRSDYAYISPTRGGYYKYHSEKATWTDAVSTCRWEGARVFHPDSAEELELVWTQLAVGTNGGRFLRTGLSDLVKPKEYKTVDGRPISQVYNKWNPREPDSGLLNKFHCGALDPLYHLLLVYDCDSPLPFICKHEKEVTAIDLKTVTADYIPLGYTFINSTRGGYYKYHTEEGTGNGAVSTCRSEGARLFHPDSADEFELVWSKLAVSKNDRHDLFTGLSYSDQRGDFETVDGRPVSQVYSKWKPGGGGCSSLLDCCIVLGGSTRLLHSCKCHYTYRFICKHEEKVTETDVKTVTAGAIFPSGYTLINCTHAYYKLHNEVATWSEAVSTCQSEGARLFHPDSADELKQVWRTLHVGDSGGGYSDRILTGLSDLDKLGEYKTVDGRPISQVYNKWNPGQPYSCWNNECRCGQFGLNLFNTHGHNVELYVYRCDVTGRFICKHEG